MEKLREFRKKNGLLQRDLAAFLGTSREFISIVESGKANLPEEQLRKLLDNDKGWDITMLRDMTIHQNGHHNIVGACNHIEEACDRALKTLCEQQRLRIEDLEAQLKNERVTNERLWAMLDKFAK